jgi:hypothetical protein
MIETIGWEKKSSYINDISTGSILIGSTDGKIFEVFIEPTDELFKKEEKFVKQVKFETIQALYFNLII